MAFISIIPFVSILFFHLSDISKYAWGYRIRKITYRNGTKRYFVQQKVPFAFIWLNCSCMIGMETYSDRSYETKEEAKEFIRKFFEWREEEKGYSIRSKETIL